MAKELRNIGQDQQNRISFLFKHLFAFEEASNKNKLYFTYTQRKSICDLSTL